MRPMSKRLLALVFLIVPFAAVMFITDYPLKTKIETTITALMTAQKLDDVQMSISNLTQQNITFSRIAFRQEDKTIELRDLSVTATALPYTELLQKNYANVAARWTLGSVTVAGLPYPLPPLGGEGVFYMKDRKPVITGHLRDAQKTHSGEFTVTSEAVLLEDIRLLWQGASVASQEIVIALGAKRPIHIPLVVKNLPLPTLLALVSSEKATGTGTVSGNIDVVVNPDGTFALGGGQFSTVNEGLIQISADALPGDQQQMQAARAALSNFHYKELKVTTSSTDRGKASIRLNLEGNNPEAFDGRPIKLNVNLTGDLLELLQQTIMPLADPSKLMEKDTQ